MGFASMLSVKDRRRLREITKAVHLKYYPTEMITDYEADKLIDSFSEAVIERTLRAGMALGVE